MIEKVIKTKEWFVAARFRLGIVGGILLAAAFAAAYFPATGNDDTHITYWASHALARVGSIINYNGERLEQSSSLTLVVVLAALEKITRLPAPTLSWLFSILCTGLAMVATACLSRSAAPRFAAWAAPLLGTSACFLYWGTSGMETSLSALLGVLTILAAARFVETDPPEKSSRARQIRHVAPVALACLAYAAVRPEAPVILLCVAVAGVASALVVRLRGKSPESRRELLRNAVFLGISALCIGLLAGWRRVVFGSAVPNPAMMKTRGFDGGLGFDYFKKWLHHQNSFFAPLLVASLAFIAWEVWKGRGKPAVIFTAAFAVASAAFIVGSGGDWMPCGRFLAPAMPVFVLLVLIALERTAGARKTVATLLCFAFLWANVESVRATSRLSDNASFDLKESLAFTRQSKNDPSLSRFAFAELANKPHRRDAKLLGPLLDAIERMKPTKERPVVIMSGQAGMVPYWIMQRHFGAAHFLDQYNLTSKELLRCVPERYRQPSNHGIWFEMQYLLSHLDELERCGVPRPHVIFDAGRAPSFLGKYGYKIIYEDRGNAAAYAAILDSGATPPNPAP